MGAYKKVKHFVKKDNTRIWSHTHHVLLNKIQFNINNSVANYRT